MTWTDEDDARLAGLRARRLDLKRIAKAMGRTFGSVQWRVRHLRMPKGAPAEEAERLTPCPGGLPPRADVTRRLDASEVSQCIECALVAIEARPRGTRYEGRLTPLAEGLAAVLGEARAEEREGRDGKV